MSKLIHDVITCIIIKKKLLGMHKGTLTSKLIFNVHSKCTTKIDNKFHLHYISVRKLEETDLVQTLYKMTY